MHAGLCLSGCLDLELPSCHSGIGEGAFKSLCILWAKSGRNEEFWGTTFWQSAREEISHVGCVERVFVEQATWQSA